MKLVRRLQKYTVYTQQMYLTDGIIHDILFKLLKENTAKCENGK